jgi:hypothetical protein
MAYTAVFNGSRSAVVHKNPGWSAIRHCTVWRVSGCSRLHCTALPGSLETEKYGSCLPRGPKSRGLLERASSNLPERQSLISLSEPAPSSQSVHCSLPSLLLVVSYSLFSSEPATSSQSVHCSLPSLLLVVSHSLFSLSEPTWRDWVMLVQQGTESLRPACRTKL